MADTVCPESLTMLTVTPVTRIPLFHTPQERQEEWWECVKSLLTSNTLTQTAGEEKNSKGEKITYDSAEYIAHVFIEAKDDGSLDPHVIVWKESQDSKSASVGFKNTVEKKKSGGADTSDESNIGYEAAAFVTALCFGLLLIGFRYREKHTKYDGE